jgi:uncharacterized membrane protein YeaQ/YmgE (transglycosylase-associated protein family)
MAKPGDVVIFRDRAGLHLTAAVKFRRNHLIYILLVGLIAGWATGKLMKGSGYGVLVDILLGIVGAFVGSRVLAMLGIFTSGGLLPSILVAIFGAVIVVALVRLIKKG